MTGSLVGYGGSEPTAVGENNILSSPQQSLIFASYHNYYEKLPSYTNGVWVICGEKGEINISEQPYIIVSDFIINDA